MKHTLITIFIFLCATQAFSQDVITKKSGDDIACKIVSRDNGKIYYRLLNSSDSSTFLISEKYVFRITYGNGTKEIILDANDERPSLQSRNKIVDTAMFNKGVKDANRYYHGHGGATIGTALTSTLAGPVLGLIPAIACGTTPPKKSHFVYPNEELTDDPNYISGYKKEARRKKIGSVWGGYFIGVCIDLIAVLLITSSHK